MTDGGVVRSLGMTVGDALLNNQLMELSDDEARSAFDVRCGSVQCNPRRLSAH